MADRVKNELVELLGVGAINGGFLSRRYQSTCSHAKAIVAEEAFPGPQGMGFVTFTLQAAVAGGESSTMCTTGCWKPEVVGLSSPIGGISTYVMIHQNPSSFRSSHYFIFHILLCPFPVVRPFLLALRPDAMPIPTTSGGIHFQGHATPPVGLCRLAAHIGHAAPTLQEAGSPHPTSCLSTQAPPAKTCSLALAACWKTR
jgi:hypothetical protein